MEVVALLLGSTYGRSDNDRFSLTIIAFLSIYLKSLRRKVSSFVDQSILEDLEGLEEKQVKSFQSLFGTVSLTRQRSS